MLCADIFSTPKDPDEIALYERKIKPSKKNPQGSFYPVVEGLKMVQRGGFAFITESSSSYCIATVRKLLCSIQ